MMIRTDCDHTDKGRNSIYKGKRRARSSCLAGTVGSEQIRQPVCESVTPHTEAFALHLYIYIFHIYIYGTIKGVCVKVLSLMAVRSMDGKQQSLIRCGSRG